MEYAKDHHRIPQTYLKFWGNSVMVYDKTTGKTERRNADSIITTRFYHSIMPGDLYTTKDSLEQFFSCLNPYLVYTIKDNGEELLLHSKEMMNQYWLDKDKWILKDITGGIVPKKQRNALLTSLSQKRDNHIEELWSKAYENIWSPTIKKIKETILGIHNKSGVAFDYYDAKLLFKFFVMFRWRSVQGPEQFNDAFHSVIDALPRNAREIKSVSTGHKDDHYLIDDVRHGLLLSYFDQFLNEEGPLQTEYEAMLERLTLVFRIDPNERLVTSDNPCFQYQDSNGIWPTFIAHPGLLIQLVRKNPENLLEFRIVEMSPDEVDLYNGIVWEKGTIIISRL